MSLPKWSRMIVSGDNVTLDQAAEIIVRTSNLTFWCNDHLWRQQLHHTLNIPPNTEKRDFPDYDRLHEVEKELGVLNLEYLLNDQIASSSITGPHGWCSWDGTIGCDGYNIGKWPSIDSVMKEWKLIAEAWPFLTLRCQLWNVECGEDYTEDDKKAKPVVEYLVENGKVTIVDRTKLRANSSYGINLGVLMLGGEQGCSLKNFKRGVELARERVRNISSNSGN